MITTYRELTSEGISTRDAADLAGVARATATRKPRTSLPVPAPWLVPANRFTDTERERVPEVVNSDEFVDLPTGHWPQLTRPEELARIIAGRAC